jgi:hypothetical protein
LTHAHADNAAERCGIFESTKEQVEKKYYKIQEDIRALYKLIEGIADKHDLKAYTEPLLTEFVDKENEHDLVSALACILHAFVRKSASHAEADRQHRDLRLKHAAVMETLQVLGGNKFPYPYTVEPRY